MMYEKYQYPNQLNLRLHFETTSEEGHSVNMFCLDFISTKHTNLLTYEKKNNKIILFFYFTCTYLMSIQMWAKNIM